MNTVTLCRTLLEGGISLILQSGLIIAVALIIAHLLGRRGPAYQALVLRSAVVAVALGGLVFFVFAGRIPSLFSFSLPAVQAQPAPAVAVPLTNPMPATPPDTVAKALSAAPAPVAPSQAIVADTVPSTPATPVSPVAQPIVRPGAHAPHFPLGSAYLA